MSAVNSLNSIEAYKDRPIMFTTHAVKHIGIKQNQTVLKLDTYNIICVPYRISVTNIVLLAFLSGDELVFFQKYINSLCGLSLVFQKPDQLESLKLFVRCTLIQIGQMKGRDNVGLINLEIKNCPNDLFAIIVDYLSYVERLKLEYDDYKDKPVALTPENAKLLQFNDYAVLNASGSTQRVRLFALCSNNAEFLTVPVSSDIPVGTPAQLKLYFQQYQFAASGKVLSTEKMPTGGFRVKTSIEMSLELVEILERYYARSRAAARGQ
jgi:hypothetical protein